MKKDLRIVCVAIMAGCFLAFSSVCLAQAPTSSSGQLENHVIETGDKLKIVVTAQESLSRDGIRVNNDGTIRIPMIKEPIPAACKTAYELADRITDLYREYLLRPEVSVEVTEYREKTASIIGEVEQRKTFTLRKPVRFLQILSLANGPTSNAGTVARIIRTNDSYRCVEGRFETNSEEFRQEVVSVDLESSLKGDVLANPLIQAGDIITVPQKDDVPVAYIYGNVGRATKLELKEQTTLSRAIAIAGGTSRGADISKIRIYRQDPKTLAKTIVVVNLKKVNKNKTRDVVLEPNDIIDVPGPTGARKFFSDIFRVLVPTVSRGIVPIP